MIVTLQYTNTEPVLCRFLEAEQLAGVMRVRVEPLHTGVPFWASEKFISPYRDGRVVDFRRNA